MIRLVLLLPLLLAGCTVLPDAIRADVGHESHMTQHEPFTSHPTRYGRGVEAGITARWQRGRWSLDASEAYSWSGNDGSPAPHEVFELKAGFDIWRKQ
jgi:starvation-inducible outer membrane lipoprotein